MRVEPYRRVLALPGVRSLMLVALLARIPIIAGGFALTLHVLLDQGRGYGAAGLVGMASTVGSALGAPLLGRFVDRRGLRPMLLVTTAAEALFWSVAPLLPYQALLVGGFVGGLLALPVFTVARQSVAALVPEEQRRQAYSLDSMATELSFMGAPALAVFVATAWTPTAAMLGTGVTTVLAGIGLYALNPPVRAHDEEPAGGTPPRRRTWLRRPMVALLLATAGATTVLVGTDVSIVAVLRHAGEVRWVGLVAATWGLYSMAGGFVHGAMRRPLPALVLMALLGLFTIPVALAGSWWTVSLLLVPAGMMCAPTLASTADGVSRLVPGAARGEAMGWYGSALTIGMATGGPVVGAVIDRLGAPWGPVAAGLAGLLVAGLALAVRGRGPAPAAQPVEESAEPGASAVAPGERGDPVVGTQRLPSGVAG